MNAWYSASRTDFVQARSASVVAELSSAAASEGWQVVAEQHQEWVATVNILKEGICREARALEILHRALEQAGLTCIADVVLEYDFRRRGLRIDCVLLAPGVIAVLEFKRSQITAADRDQVTNYCINLVEFHEETQRAVRESAMIVIPLVVLTEGRKIGPLQIRREFHPGPWASVLRNPIECDSSSLHEGLLEAISMRRGQAPVDRQKWLASRFSPSSSILDAAISLYGQHDVTAIHEHAAPKELIRACVEEVLRHVQEARDTRRNRVIFVSGAPGAGKTLVGLQIAFAPRYSGDAVFVTGNAPLVDVLNEALQQSYRKKASVSHISGYPRESAALVIQNSDFKIVKAHRFLAERGAQTNATDGSLVIFDEAQRTYEKGRRVLNRALEDHEADLILASLEKSNGSGAVVVALLGHNQAINSGERGAIAWLEAADRRRWDFAIADETLDRGEFDNVAKWKGHAARRIMPFGHLSHSLRFYRNKELEAWVDALLNNDTETARSLGLMLSREGHPIWVTRSLAVAKAWVRSQRIGSERAGLIASGQARRLAAEGLFVDHKPPIESWMLAPSGDVRSSNMLETVQNQFQIQGLELDYTIVCWDIDLRRSNAAWSAHKMKGAEWQNDARLDIAMNSYRVLLTRARKGMVLFVPMGDQGGEDGTRDPARYTEVAQYLIASGGVELARED